MNQLELDISVACLAVNNGGRELRITPQEAYTLRQSTFCPACPAKQVCDAYAATQPSDWPRGYTKIWCKAAAVKQGSPHTTVCLRLEQAAANYNGHAACARCTNSKLRSNCNHLAMFARDKVVLVPATVWK